MVRCYNNQSHSHTSIRTTTKLVIDQLRVEDKSITQTIADHLCQQLNFGRSISDFRVLLSRTIFIVKDELLNYPRSTNLRARNEIQNIEKINIFRFRDGGLAWEKRKVYVRFRCTGWQTSTFDRPTSLSWSTTPFKSYRHLNSIHMFTQQNLVFGNFVGFIACSRNNQPF